VDAVRLLGPDTFIMLSGFLLCRSFMHPERSLYETLRRRVIRIFPVYLLVLAIYLVCGLWTPVEPRIPSDPVAAVTYVIGNAALFPLAFGMEPVIGAAWTLGVLMVLYVTFPTIARVLGLGSWCPRRRAAAFIAAAGLLAVPATPLSTGAALFVSGATARELSDLIPRSRPAMLLLLTTTVVALTLRTSDVLPHSMRIVMRISAVAPLLVLLRARCLPRVRSVFENPVVRGFGRMSYSYYLVHSCVIVAIKLLLFDVAGTLVPVWALVPALLTLCFAATLAASALVYKIVEKPLRVWQTPITVP
jgi:exopolysaccharide production protein ExoZ